MKTYNLNDLTNSRIQYDKNPPKFMMYIIIIILLLIIGIITLSSFTYKTEIVCATGILSSENKTTIQSSTSGKITNVYYNSGDYVEKGTLLFELDSTQIIESITSLSSKVEFMNNYLKGYSELISYIESINVNANELISNPFEKNDFYYMLETFLNAYNKTSANDLSGINVEESKKQLKNQYLQSYYQSKFQYEYDLIGNQSQLEAYENMLTNYKVYAPTSGYLNYTTKLNSGMVIDSNAIGTISEKINDSNAQIECFIDASHRSFVNVEDPVEIVMSGLSQSKYGTLSGKIISISDDIISNNENNVFYKVVVKPLSIKLDDIELLNGQAGEVRIKYDSLTWTTWALKKVGIIDR